MKITDIILVFFRIGLIATVVYAAFSMFAAAVFGKRLTGGRRNTAIGGVQGVTLR